MGRARQQAARLLASIALEEAGERVAAAEATDKLLARLLGEGKS